MNFKKIVIASLMLLLVGVARAEEGMWLLPYINKNIKDMKAKGYRLTAEDIYSLNGESSLSKAVVIFGGGCTAEVISDKGLLLTNHHCGYGAIQSHSTVDNDYLKYGFWAMNDKEELPNPGLSVTFIQRIEDVSSKILPKLNDNMSEKERNDKVNEIKAEIIKDTKIRKSGESVSIETFFGGNQYILFVKRDFKDIRLVGTPPSSIGKFGGDTDNWMWPRHTGDFSIFRIYADKDGNPAEYSPDNVPYTPEKYLPISIKGVDKDDFVMVLGFPGRTQRYMSSYEIDETLSNNNPNRIKIRGIRQDILLEDMQADPKVNIQYASKYSGSSNYWKNSMGMSKGLTKLNVKEEKEAIESAFTQWVNADAKRKQIYSEALPLKKMAIDSRRPYIKSIQYIDESMYRSIELLSYARNFAAVAEQIKKGELTDDKTSKIISSLDGMYKDYNAPTDRKVAKAMVKLFMADISKESYPEVFGVIDSQFNGDTDAAVDYLYDNSMFISKEKAVELMENPSYEKIVNDPAYIMLKSINDRYKKLQSNVTEYKDMLDKGHRLFIRGLLEMQSDKLNYPDANFTMRLTYGNVLPYSPADAVTYNYKTFLKGVIEKEDPNNLYEFEVSDKLKELYKDKDYGRYAENGDVPVAFIANLDITGGNSGSPVINGGGQLVGIAFDGNWEALSGDIAFEPQLQRCIAVDIKYVLFVIDKYAGCTRLIDEMKIVE